MTPAQVFAVYSGIQLADVESFLLKCDVVVIPGGAIVRHENRVHIVAPQSGLSGRALVAATRAALDRFHEAELTLVCPIRHENLRTIRYAKHFGFRSYSSKETHVWLYRHKGDPYHEI